MRLGELLGPVVTCQVAERTGRHLIARRGDTLEPIFLDGTGRDALPEEGDTVVVRADGIVSSGELAMDAAGPRAWAAADLRRLAALAETETADSGWRPRCPQTGPSSVRFAFVRYRHAQVPAKWRREASLFGRAFNPILFGRSFRGLATLALFEREAWFELPRPEGWRHAHASRLYAALADDYFAGRDELPMPEEMAARMAEVLADGPKRTPTELCAECRFREIYEGSGAAEGRYEVRVHPFPTHPTEEWRVEEDCELVPAADGPVRLKPIWKDPEIRRALRDEVGLHARHDSLLAFEVFRLARRLGLEVLEDEEKSAA